VNSGFRLWNDTNGNFFPDCDLTSTAANGECGGLSTPLGQVNTTTTWDPSVLRGWGVRPSDIELLFGMQQKVTDRLMMDVQWTRHSFGNMFATQYRAQPASAYDSYCVTAPSNAKLPGGGGNQICGFDDIKPSYNGITPNNLVTAANNLGNVTDVYTGVDANFLARFAGGGQGSIGVSTGRERTDYCSIAGLAQIGSNTDTSAGKIFLDNYVGNNISNTGPSASAYPSSLYCSVAPPFQPDWKGLLSYPLPWWGLRASATWQNRPGPQILATEAATQASPSLGRPLTLPTALVNFVAPGTMYEPRINQVDLRLSKALTFGRTRLQLTASSYNLFNTNVAMAINTAYSATWLQPTIVLQGRLFKFGAQLDF
jgi:hypothetical protein